MNENPFDIYDESGSDTGTSGCIRNTIGLLVGRLLVGRSKRRLCLLFSTWMMRPEEPAAAVPKGGSGGGPVILGCQIDRITCLSLDRITSWDAN